MTDILKQLREALEALPANECNKLKEDIRALLEEPLGNVSIDKAFLSEVLKECDEWASYYLPAYQVYELNIHIRALKDAVRLADGEVVEVDRRALKEVAEVVDKEKLRCVLNTK